MQKSGWIAIGITAVAILGIVALKLPGGGAGKPATTPATAAGKPGAAPVQPVTPTVPASSGGLTGDWIDQDNATYVLVQQGQVLTITGNDETRVMKGIGIITDETVAISLTNTVDIGTTQCTGKLVDPQTIKAECTVSGGNNYDWTLRRTAA